MNRTLPLVTSLALGCVDVAYPAFRSTHDPIAQERAAREAADQARDTQQQPPAEDNPLRVLLQEGDVSYGVAGPLRIEVRGRAVRVASEALPSGIRDVTHAARGWVFYTVNDEVYVSERFLDAPRALGSFHCEGEADDDTNRGITESEGRVTLRTGAAGTYWCDGRRIERVALDGASSVAWRGDTHGAAVQRRAALSVTHDGGRSWREVPMGRELPLRVITRGGTLYVRTTQAWMRLTDDTLEPVEQLPSSPTDALRPLPSEMYDALTRASRSSARRVASPTPQCPARGDAHDAPARAWTPPEFAVPFPVHHDRYGAPSLVVPRGSPAPLGRAIDRANSGNANLPVVVSLQGPAPLRAGAPINLAWRGEDDRGSFSQRITTTVPEGVPAASTWTLVAATRTGLLYAIDGDVDVGDEAPAVVRASLGMYWFGAAGHHPVRLDGHREVLTRGASLALADGGAVVWVAQDVGAPDPVFTTALRLSPDGAVVAHFHELGTSVLGFGEAGTRVGIVTRDPGGLTLRTFEGETVPFGDWNVDDLPHTCGDAHGPTARLHVWQHDDDDASGTLEEPLPITVGAGFDAPDFATTRLLTLERPLDSDGAPCVRRVWGMHHLEYEVDDGDDDYAERLWGAFRLTARGGRLVGVYDSGDRIGRATFRIEPRGHDPYGLGMGDL